MPTKQQVPEPPGSLNIHVVGITRLQDIHIESEERTMNWESSFIISQAPLYAVCEYEPLAQICEIIVYNLGSSDTCPGIPLIYELL